MSGARATAGLLIVAGLLMASPARADLWSRTTPLDLTPGVQTIDLVAPSAPAPVATVDRAAEEVWADAIPTLVARAAAGTGVPSDFLLRLLRQESGLNRLAVSPKGAQGIAQFMPATAAERGLLDPFDPAQAIPKAAELLRDLRGRYGNWGLAAAAYNAGPGRIDAWLLGRISLPTETVDYVARITGIDAATWAAGHRLAGTIVLSQSVSPPLAFASLGTDATLALLPMPTRRDTRARETSRPDPRADQGTRAPLSTAQLRAAVGGTAWSKLRRGEATGPCAALLTADTPCLVFTRY